MKNKFRARRRELVVRWRDFRRGVDRLADEAGVHPSVIMGDMTGKGWDDQYTFDEAMSDRFSEELLMTTDELEDRYYDHAR